MKKYGHYAVVDLEMCMVPDHNSPGHQGLETIQIGAAMLNRDYKMVSTFDTFVCPEYGQVNAFIEQLTGIHENDLEGAPKMEQALSSFMDWVHTYDTDGNVGALSWSMSDASQLRKETAGKNIEIPGLSCLLDNWVDAQKLFSKRMNTKHSYKLSEALFAAGIVPEGQEHNGMSDAVNTAALLSKLLSGTLVLNPIYESMTREETTPLTFSLGEAFKGLKFDS